MSEGLEARLAAYQRFGIKLGLENIRALCSGLGHPESAVPAIHVAGTNGKGSTVAYLSAIFQGANYRTGVYTSPHLVDVTERIAIDGVPVTPAYLDRILDTVDDIAAVALSNEHPDAASPTYFEALTAAAFYAFARRQIDVAIYEVGMGGRLDSTNVILPEVTCITTIGLDHTKHLGKTLQDIAGEKAGIIKPGVPVVCGRIGAESLEVITSAAAKANAPLRLLDADFGVRAGARMTESGIQHAVWWGTGHADLEFDIPLHGPWQLDNAACALAMAHWLVEDGWNISSRSMQIGLKDVRWPGRLEWLSRTPPVLFDSAHNPHALRAVVPGLQAEISQGVLPILAVLDDKDAANMCEVLRAFGPTVIVTAAEQPRAMPVKQLSNPAGQVFSHVIAAPTIAEALRAAQETAPERAAFVVGSIMNYAEAQAEARGETAVTDDR